MGRAKKAWDTDVVAEAPACCLGQADTTGLWVCARKQHSTVLQQIGDIGRGVLVPVLQLFSFEPKIHPCLQNGIK